MVDFKSNMLSNLVKNTEYNKTLDAQFSSTFGGKTKLTKDELFAKEASLFDAYNKLNDTGKKNFNAVIGMDGDKNTISEKEYRMLKTLLDAEKKGDNYIADNQVNIGKNSAINTANASQLKAMYTGAKETPKVQAQAPQQAPKISPNDFMEQIKDYVQDLPATPTYNALKAEFPDGFDKNNPEHLMKLGIFAKNHYNESDPGVLQKAILKFTDGQVISSKDTLRRYSGIPSLTILPDANSMAKIDDVNKIIQGNNKLSKINSFFYIASVVDGGMSVQYSPANNCCFIWKTSENGENEDFTYRDGQLNPRKATE